MHRILIAGFAYDVFLVVLHQSVLDKISKCGQILRMVSSSDMCSCSNITQTPCGLLVCAHQAELPKPIIFEIKNVETKKVSHCGVLEFMAPEEHVYLPRWVCLPRDTSLVAFESDVEHGAAW